MKELVLLLIKSEIGCISASSSFQSRKVDKTALAMALLSCKVWMDIYMKGVKAEKNKVYWMGSSFEELKYSENQITSLYLLPPETGVTFSTVFLLL